MKHSLTKISKQNWRIFTVVKDSEIPWEVKKELNNIINLQFLEITKAMQQLEKVEEYLDSCKRR